MQGAAEQARSGEPTMRPAWRLAWLVGLLLIAVGTLSYRLWCVHQLRSRLATARTHLENGYPAESISVLRPLLDAGRQDGELYYLAAMSHRLLGDPMKSLELATRAFELGYDATAADRERGLALFDLGRFQEALQLLRGDSTRGSVAVLALIHLQLFQMDEALKYLDAWLGLDPENPLPYLVRGDVWMQAPDYEKAVEDFRRGAKLEPGSYEIRLKLSSALLETGRLEEAAQILRQCHEEQPTEATATQSLARCELELGSTAASRELLERLVEQQPNLPRAMVELGKLELDDGNSEKAAELLQRAIALDARNDSALYNLATVLKRIDREEESQQYLAQWREIQSRRRGLTDLMDRVRADPSDIESFVAAGVAFMDLGDTPQAWRYLTAALARDPNHAAAQAALDRLTEPFSIGSRP